MQWCLPAKCALSTLLGAVQKVEAEKGLVASLGPTAQPGSSTFVGQLLGPDSVMIPAPETGAPQPPRDPTIITVHDRKVRLQRGAHQLPPSLFLLACPHSVASQV